MYGSNYLLLLPPLDLRTDLTRPALNCLAQKG